MLYKGYNNLNMSNKEYFEFTDDEIAYIIPEIGAFLPNQNTNENPTIIMYELVMISYLTWTPVYELIKPIRYPYWSL